MLVKSLRAMLFTLLFMVVLIACETIPKASEGEVSITIEPPTTNTFNVGETVVLKAMVTAPAGTSKAVTWSSSDENIATVTSSGNVTGMEAGTAEITATSQADTSKKDSVGLSVQKASCPEPVEISRSFAEDTTWTDVVTVAGCVDYLVTRYLQNSAYKLVVEPDVIIAFSKDTGLLTKDDASLTAEGTADKPIIFTGAEKTRGFWQGLAFRGSAHPENRLDYVTIEYGGSKEFVSVRANLGLASSSLTLSTVAVTNSVIRESSGYGIFLSFNNKLSEFSNNTVTKNATGPAWTYASSVHNFSEDSDYTGNDRDVVDVRSNVIAESVTWAAIADYHLLEGGGEEGFRVEGDDAFLTLEPGVTLIFDEGLGMLVRSGGGLSAVGTAEKPVTLTGSEKKRGYWKGLYFYDTGKASKLDFATIEYGGSKAYSITNTPANLAVSRGFGTQAVSISNTTLRHSAGHGLYNRFGAEITNFTGNTLTQNALGPAYVDAPSAAYLLDSSSYTGNDVDRVAVYTSSIMIDEDATWYDLGVPFVIVKALNEIFQVDGAILTLKPGVEILFQNNMGLSIRNEGKLMAEGTAEKRIVLADDNTQWRGLEVFDSTASLAHMTIENGGSEAWSFVSGNKGNVTITTFFADEPPFASVTFGDGMAQSGAEHGAVFGVGKVSGSGLGCSAMGPFYRADELPGKCN